MMAWDSACRPVAGWLLGGLLCALMAACAGPEVKTAEMAMAEFPPMASGSAPGASPQALAMNSALGRGVNFGNMLEAPTEGAWGVRLQEDYFDKVVEAGFQSVRLPVRWSNHAALSGDAVIDEAFAKRVDHAVDELLKRKLVVVLNMHHYRQLDGDALDAGEAVVNRAVLELRFLNLWKQIAQRYRDKPANLVFELYNEPHGSQNDSWNELAARALNVVRQTNPTRIVVIGPTLLAQRQCTEQAGAAERPAPHRDGAQLRALRIHPPRCGMGKPCRRMAGHTLLFGAPANEGASPTGCSCCLVGTPALSHLSG